MAGSRWFAGAAAAAAVLAVGWILRPDFAPESHRPRERPVGVDVVRLVLPFDAYAMTAADIAVLMTAQDTVIARCVLREGRTWPVPDRTVAVESQNQRRYGVIEDEVARQYGFHPPPVASDELTAEEAPPEECAQEARAALIRGVPTADRALLNGLDGQIWAEVQRDPRVVRGFADWSKCMRRNGYRYANPFAVNNDERWRSATPSAAEIATTTADVACKRKTSVVSTWFGIEAAAQRKATTIHRREFAELRAAKHHELANARAIIASATRQRMGGPRSKRVGAQVLGVDLMACSGPRQMLRPLIHETEWL